LTKEGALVEHDRVLTRSSSSISRAALGAAILALSTHARADPPPMAAPAAPPAPPVALAPPAAPGAWGAAWTRVHIVADRPGVALERRAGSLPTDRPLPPLGVYTSEPVWDPVCKAPCDLDARVDEGGGARRA